VLEEYSWPGNIRELENVIERGILIANDKYIMPEDLSIFNDQKTKKDLNRVEQSDDDQGLSIHLSPGGMNLKNIERELIAQALKKTGGVQNKAAKLLGISSRVINYKIKKYGLQQ